ncbi:hypothetical protein ACWDWU_14200 [Streptomyces sp. NPDC003442]
MGIPHVSIAALARILGFIADGRIEPVVEEIPFGDLNQGLE